LLVATNKRFQHTVEGEQLLQSNGAWQNQRDVLLQQLTSTDRQRQEQLEDRCRGILDTNKEQSLERHQAENLAQLAWVHLRLLLSRNRLQQVVKEAEQPDELTKRINELEKKLAGTIHEQLRTSLASQLEILNARQASFSKASEQLTLIEAELERLRQQVELVREQSALSSDPGVASRTIDSLGATLNETSRWLSDQRDVLGEVEDLSVAPPPTALFAARPIQQPPQRT
jgi:hypothetical protein